MNSVTIADDMLKLAKRRGLNITPMQLVKLAYIAYGWHLAMKNKRLFNDRIEVWRYGPIIPKLYYATKRFGNETIRHSLISNSHVTNSELE